MKKYFIMLIVFCLCLSINAQENTRVDSLSEAYVEKISRVQDSAILKKDISIYDDFLKNNPPNPNIGKELAFTLMARAQILAGINYKKIRNGDATLPENRKIINEIHESAQRAIDICDECCTQNRNAYNTIMQSLFLNNEAQFNPNLVILKQKGYKIDKDGPSIAVTISQSKGTWIGGEISVFGFQGPPYRIREIDPKTGKKYTVGKEEYGHIFTLLPVAYRYNFNTKAENLTVSLFRLNSLVTVDPLSFGFHSYKKSQVPVGLDSYGSIYYRFELGVAYGGLALSYNYTHFFNKDFRQLEQRSGLILRYQYMFSAKY